MDNIPNEIVMLQRKVFEHFSYSIHQINTNLSHAEAIDQYLLSEKWQSISIFDIDCIPIRANVIEEAQRLCNQNILFGAAQQANHLDNKHIYVAPSFFNISFELFSIIGKPSFRQTNQSDVGGEISIICKRAGIPLCFIYPTEFEYPKWKLGDSMMYGPGTVFGNMVFHAFRIRMKDYQQRFINRCLEILRG